MRILYGTGNKAKVEAMRKIIRIHGFDVELLTTKDVGFDKEIVEDGTTFEENSEIKANAIKEFCKENNINDVLVLTDDAGLCVDALNGEPGVYTGRYAGDHATQIENIDKLLGKMKDLEGDQRKATFVCVLTMILENGEKIVARGECFGTIAKEHGVLGGLTYGPVFVPQGFDKPMNDLDEEEFASVHNHRDLAALEIMSKLKELGYGNN